ncbi:hypothetical protein DVH24_020810 [Malus domestica]|uniref:Uncharacterized protein n=1 Tax=Malus domestica TaxID=3750 RepID=A0A498JAK0_MALDO|nr:hypothetical protein DVH24_020810 [Malus domestica]
MSEPENEFRLSQTYHEGFHKLQVKEYKKAAELLESVLKDPLIENGQGSVDGSVSDCHLLQLRFLGLRNLQQGAAYYESAFRCYLQAVETDTKDSIHDDCYCDEVACLSVAELTLRH